jgi:hypothetical protein
MEHAESACWERLHRYNCASRREGFRQRPRIPVAALKEGKEGGSEGGGVNTREGVCPEKKRAGSLVQQPLPGAFAAVGGVGGIRAGCIQETLRKELQFDGMLLPSIHTH